MTLHVFDNEPRSLAFVKLSRATALKAQECCCQLRLTQRVALIEERSVVKENPAGVIIQLKFIAILSKRAR